MRHRRLRRKLGVKSQHRKALLRNLIRALVERKRIHTTLAKAREASSFADKLVTLAKRGDLHARRLLVSKLGCADTVKVLVKDIAPHFKDRNGGYTRVLRTGYRQSDASEMAILEFSALVEAPKEAKPKKEKKSKQKPKTAAKEETKAAEKPVSKKKDQEKGKAEETAKEGEKETPKKGGFLGTLRKFLKGE